MPLEGKTSDRIVNGVTTPPRTFPLQSELRPSGLAWTSHRHLSPSDRDSNLVLGNPITSFPFQSPAWEGSCCAKRDFKISQTVWVKTPLNQYVLLLHSTLVWIHSGGVMREIHGACTGSAAIVSCNGRLSERFSSTSRSVHMGLERIAARASILLAPPAVMPTIFVAAGPYGRTQLGNRYGITTSNRCAPRTWIHSLRGHSRHSPNDRHPP